MIKNNTIFKKGEHFSPFDLCKALKNKKIKKNKNFFKTDKKMNILYMRDVFKVQM